MASQQALFSISTVSTLGATKQRILRAGREAKKAREATRNVGEQVRTQLRKTTKTWNHSVTFDLSVTSKGGSDEVGFEISTDDEIWHYLDKGTSYKLVSVSSNWQPKTIPSEYNSYPGGGYVFWTGPSGERKATHFRAGVVPRRWSTTPAFLKGIQEMLYEEVQRKLGELVDEING